MTQPANQVAMSVIGIDPSPTMQIFKRTKRVLKRVVLLALPVIFIPKVLAVYLACGLLDVTRNRNPNLALFERSFLTTHCSTNRAMKPTRCVIACSWTCSAPAHYRV